MATTQDRDPLRLTKGQRELTPTQRAAAYQLAQEYRATILSTEPVDEAAVERAVHEAYQVDGIMPPERIRWFDSPLGFVLARHHPFDWVSVEVSLGGSVLDVFMGGVGASLWVGVRDSIWDSVRELNTSAWDAFPSYFHNHPAPNACDPLARVNRATHGCYFRERECWLVRRPLKLDFDESGRLHSEDGMAIRYRDGWGLYAWHGVRVSKRVILAPETITKEDWSTEHNAEVRRVMQERLGADRFIALLGATELHRDECGTLLEVALPEDPERVARYVRVQDTSTERIYHLRVPPTIQRARAGIAWTFSISEAEYCPLQET